EAFEHGDVSGGVFAGGGGHSVLSGILRIRARRTGRLLFVDLRDNATRSRVDDVVWPAASDAGLRQIVIDMPAVRPKLDRDSVAGQFPVSREGVLLGDAKDLVGWNLPRC